jgi:hypothetical protein
MGGAWRRCSVALVLLPLLSGCALLAQLRAADPTRPVTGFRLISYRGVHLVAPAGWPVLDGIDTGSCGGPFFNPATVYLGPQDNPFLPFCAPLPPNSPTFDGVWLQPGEPATAAHPVTTTSGQRLLEETPRLDNPVRSLWYHHVLIEIGVGPIPAVVDAIFQSISYTAGAPDTRAGGVCARQRHRRSCRTPNGSRVA